MGNFNRDNRSSRGRDFRRGGFGERSFDRPTMHQAICDKCGKNCEVPFRPTSGKPVYCSDCFEKSGSDSRRPEGRNFDRPSYEEKRMFDAVCSSCGNNCKVPFQPRGDKPIYCSDCFGKNEGGERNTRPTQNSNPSNEQFQALNAKLDRILKLLSPEVSDNNVIEAEKPAEVSSPIIEGTLAPIVEKTKKTSRKAAPIQES